MIIFDLKDLLLNQEPRRSHRVLHMNANRQNEKFRYSYHIFAYWYDPAWNNFVGATVKIWDLAHNLSKIGHDVVLYLPKNNFNKDNLPFQLIEIPFINIPYIRFISFNLILIIHILFQYSNLRPDVVYVRRMSTLIPSIYAKIKSALFFYEINDDPYAKVRKYNSKAIDRFRAFLSARIDNLNLKLCDKAFVITKDIANAIFRKNQHLKKDLVTIFPSGANTHLFKPQDMNFCRKKLGLCNKTKIVGFTGSMLKYQGVEILIQAARSVILSIPDVKFIIAGEGPAKEKCRLLAQKIGIISAISFIGQVPYEQMPIWLNACNICVAPYLKSAGFSSPVKIFDYMSCGKPVVASKVNGTTNDFHDGLGICLVEPENPDILAMKIIELLNDGSKAIKIGKEARKIIVKKFDRKYLANQVFNEAQNLIK